MYVNLTQSLDMVNHFGKGYAQAIESTDGECLPPLVYTSTQDTNKSLRDPEHFGKFLVNIAINTSLHRLNFTPVARLLYLLKHYSFSIKIVLKEPFFYECCHTHKKI